MAGLVVTEGFSVSVSDLHRAETVATIYGQKIKFGFVEQVDWIQTNVPPSGSLVDRVLKYDAQPPLPREPSGKLRIEVFDVWSSHKKPTHQSRNLLQRLPSQPFSLLG